MGKPDDIMGSDNLVGRQYLRPELAKRVESGDAAMSQLAAAHEKYRSFYHGMRKAVSQRDPAATEDAHFLDMRDIASKTVVQAARANDLAVEQARQEVEFTRTALKSNLGLVEDHRASEIRTYMRSLEPDKRGSLVQTAVTSGDAKTIAAITEAPAYLSGHNEKAIAGVKSQYESKHGGDLPQRIRDLEKAIEINRKTGDDALTFLDRLLPHQRYEEIQKKQAAANAMRAQVSG